MNRIINYFKKDKQMNLKKAASAWFSIISLILLLGLVMFQACSTSTDLSETVLKDINGTLRWGGAPAVDGTGILFETSDTTYGAPGTRENYSEFFPEGENKVQVIADINITGKTTVRGWDAEYPEIEIFSLSVTTQNL